MLLQHYLAYSRIHGLSHGKSFSYEFSWPLIIPIPSRIFYFQLKWIDLIFLFQYFLPIFKSLSTVLSYLCRGWLAWYILLKIQVSELYYCDRFHLLFVCSALSAPDSDTMWKNNLSFSLLSSINVGWICSSFTIEFEINIWYN